MTPADFKAARVAMGYTQAALATALVVSPSTIRRWEMDPSVKSSRKVNYHAAVIVKHMMFTKGIKL